MANDLLGNPWKIDTAGAGAVVDDMVYVKSVRWVSETAVGGDNVSVTDPVTSRVLWEAVAAGANYTEEALIESWWRNGFAVPTIGSGTLYVTYG